MRGFHILLQWLAVSLGPVLAAQQRTLVVDAATGPFFDLPEAVAASRPGDRIEIHAAATPYSSSTIPHGLDLDAQAGASVLSLTIQNLQPFHAVRVEGLAIGTNLPTAFGGSLRLTSCLGPVHLHRVAVTYGLVVDGCPLVTMSDCSVTGTYLFVNLSSCAFMSNSTVVAVRSQFHGYGGLSAFGPTRGQDGIALTHSKLVLVDSLVGGGDGSVPPYGCGSLGARPGDGGNAITADYFPTNSVVLAVGTSQIVRGLGGYCSNVGLSGAPGGACVGSAALRLGPSVTLIGYVSSSPVAIQEPPSLSHPAQLQQGVVANLTVATRPQSVVLLGLDTWNGYLELPGSELPILLPLATASLAGIAVADSVGNASFALPVPVAPWIANQFAVLQGVSVDAQGTLQLSGPGLMRIR